ncbi:MAG: pilus assembly protein [Actinomycetia bacterium]|nr:pilus assembly protein [Actinomycetes bacterium]
MGLPLLLAVALGLVWMLSVGVAQMRTVDAAREAARALARGDDPGAAVAAGQRVAPSGVSVAVTADGGQVVATASGRVAGPGGLFGFLPGAGVRATAEALAEGDDRSVGSQPGVGVGP